MNTSNELLIRNSLVWPMGVIVVVPFDGCKELQRRRQRAEA